MVAFTILFMNESVMRPSGESYPFISMAVSWPDEWLNANSFSAGAIVVLDFNGKSLHSLLGKSWNIPPATPIRRL